MSRLQNIKAVVSKYHNDEYGMHDTISATEAISALGNSIYSGIHGFSAGGLIAAILRYAERVAQDGEENVGYPINIEKIVNEDIKAKRVYIWGLDNLYAREILKIITEKQQATKLLRQI